MKIGKRTFSEKDQQDFAFFSGDFNPIHLDKSHARKLISGQCIVHGIHSLLWALEVLLQETGKVFGNITVNFKKQIFLNETVEAIWNAEKNQLIVTKGSTVLVSIRLSEEVLHCPNFGKFTMPVVQEEKRIAEDLKISDIQVGQTFEFSFRGSTRYAKPMFPSLTEFLGIELVSQVASLSDVIGMQVPGLHSTFTKASISLESQTEKQEIRVQKVDERFNLVTLSCHQRNMSAHLEAFFRPTPIEIPPCNTLRSDLKNLDLQRVKALIVGGSRGLGAWTAKVISLLGGEVTITYNTGKGDAEQIQSDIKMAGGKCSITKLSIERNCALKLPGGEFNQIYYFATPKIFGKRDASFDAHLYDNFSLIYVEKFESIVEQAIERGVTDILYPSTGAIDEPVRGLEEYIQAKIEGEKVCASFANRNCIRIYKPRIPRVLTDQTTSIIPAHSEHPLNIILPIIRQMAL